LTLICPTIDRTSLKLVLDRVQPQLRRGDEFIVVGDGPCPRARAWCKGRTRVRYIELPSRVGDYGCTPCDVAMKEAKGDYIFLTGDDDMPTEDAFKKVREGVKDDDPKRPALHIFAMWHGGVNNGQGAILGGSLNVGFVSGQQIVFHNNPDMIVRMAAFDEFAGDRYSDWDFIMRMVDKYGPARGVFHHEVINCLTSQNLGKTF
jgi:hypothetical protein